MQVTIYVYDFMFLSEDLNFTIDKNKTIIPVNNLEVIKSIPMLTRRRLHPAGRYAVGATVKMLYENNNVAALIYASRTGETKRCISFLQKALHDEPSSPADFSASVHNANVGIASIAGNFNGETIALSAKKDTLYSAFIESYLLLNSYEYKNVILALYEENLQDQHFVDLSKVEELFRGFAITLTLALSPSFMGKTPLFSLTLGIGEDGGDDAEKLILNDKVHLTAYEFFKNISLS